MFLPDKRRPLWVRLVMIAAAAGLFVVGYQWGNRFKHHRGPPAIAGVLVSPPIELSDFHLQDPDGLPVDRERLGQGWTLLTYGDLTSAQGHLAINRLIEIRNRLADHPELSADLRLVLVQTSDAPNLARDFSRLTPSLLIAGGGPNELAKLADALGGAPPPVPGDDAGAMLFLIAPGARLVALFTPGQGPATVATDLVALSEYPDLLTHTEPPAPRSGSAAITEGAPESKDSLPMEPATQ
jgi:hypothetical protein